MLKTFIVGTVLLGFTSPSISAEYKFDFNKYNDFETLKNDLYDIGITAPVGSEPNSSWAFTPKVDNDNPAKLKAYGEVDFYFSQAVTEVSFKYKIKDSFDWISLSYDGMDVANSANIVKDGWGGEFESGFEIDSGNSDYWLSWVAPSGEDRPWTKTEFEHLSKLKGTLILNFKKPVTHLNIQIEGWSAKKMIKLGGWSEDTFDTASMQLYNMSVTQEPAQTPLPGALGLLASGLLGFCGIRRRFGSKEA